MSFEGNIHPCLSFIALSGLYLGIFPRVPGLVGLREVSLPVSRSTRKPLICAWTEEIMLTHLMIRYWRHSLNILDT